MPLKERARGTIRKRHALQADSTFQSMDSIPNAPSHKEALGQDRTDRSLDEYLEAAYASSGAKVQYWLIMLALGVSNSSDASEILCISYILSDEAFDRQILLGTAWRGGLLASAVFLGMLLGGLFVGTLGDWVGRRPMLMVGLVCNAVAGILSAVATDVFVLAFLRCIAGIGIGATVPPLFTLVAELAPPSKRGFFVTFCASFWMVGSIYVALAAMLSFQYFQWSWRIFAVTCAAPSALGAFMVHALVPESPRYLALNQHHEQALKVTHQLARDMDFDGSPLSLTELQSCFPQHSDATASNGLTQSSSILSMFTAAIRDFFVGARKLYTPEMTRTTWPLQMVWFSLSFGSYGLMTWINTLFVEVHLKNVYFNALLFALSNLPGNIISAVFLDRVGRSVMLIGSILAAAISLVSFAAFAASENLHATAIVLSACSFQCFTIAAWNTIDVMTSELFPTSVRSTGMGVCAASGRIGAMIAQFVNGALVASPVRLLLVASLTLALGATTPCLLPGADMTGRPVQDEIVSRSGQEAYRRLSRDDIESLPQYQDSTELL